MRFIFILLVGLMVSFGCSDKQNNTVENNRPNIIFIMADDLGYGDVGPYGQNRIKTPNIDRMAKEGMTFTQFYAGTSVCAPSRAVLITGLHTGHVEIRGNRQYGYQNGQQPLSAGTQTIGTALQQAGYTTGMIGKWGLGDPNTPGNPLKQGFDFFFGYTDQVLAHNYYPEYLWRNNKKQYLTNEVHYLDTSLWHDGLGSYSSKREEYAQDLFLDQTLDFIDRNKGTSFFLYLPFTIPHDNGEQTDSMRFEVPAQGIYAHENWTKKAKDYAAMISYLDEGVGKILNQLKTLGLDKTTLVIFTSDNGPMRNIPTTRFFDSNGPLRGGKRDLYEGGMRVPCIAWWPGMISQNSKSDHIGAFWDLLPTFVELSDADLNQKTDGISIVPALLSKGEQQSHAHLYWEFHEQNGIQAIRQGKWKAVRLDAKTEPGNPLELYNLENDLEESKNIADLYPEKVKELDSLMTASRNHSELFPFAKI